MEKHTCKFCSRRFSNGRALGGHMRSHVTSATAKSVSPCLPQRFYSPPISSSSSGPVEASEVVGVVKLKEENPAPAIVGGGVGVEVEGCYRLRENPRKSFKFSDPEFSALDYFNLAGENANTNTSFSVLVQDRESETESSIPASTTFRRRSKRRRRRQSSPSVPSPPPQPPPEVEPVSSVSDATPDEDVALCLIMLSRDFWSNSKPMDSPKQEEEEKEEEDNYMTASSSSSEEERRRRRVKNISGNGSGSGSGSGNGKGGGRSRFQCGTCKKVFRSYQALGGHRASHKRIKDQQHGHHHHRSKDEIREVEEEEEEDDRRIHECPFCFRVFTSGQALGGHKRSHLVAGHSLPVPQLPPKQEVEVEEEVLPVNVDVCGSIKIKETLIDLNLPAPMEDDDEGEEEVEFSAVSDTS